MIRILVLIWLMSAVREWWHVPLAFDGAARERSYDWLACRGFVCGLQSYRPWRGGAAWLADRDASQAARGGTRALISGPGCIRCAHECTMLVFLVRWISRSI